MTLAVLSTTLAAIGLAQAWLTRHHVRWAWLIVIAIQVPWTIWDVAVGWAALGPFVMGVAQAWNAWRGWREWGQA